MKVFVFSSDLGPLTDAVRILSLHPWYSPQCAKGCLRQTLATGCMRALSGVSSVSIVGRPKCPTELVPPRSSSQPAMGKPEVPSGAELQLFTLVTTFLTHCLWLPPFLVSLHYPLKEFPRNTFQIKNLSQVPLLGNPMKHTSTAEFLKPLRWEVTSL